MTAKTLLVTRFIANVPLHVIAPLPEREDFNQTKPMNMSLLKLRNLTGIVAALCLIVMPLQAHAKPVKSKSAEVTQPTEAR